MEMADRNYYSYKLAFVRSTCKAGLEDKPIFCHFISPPLMPVYNALLHISEVAPRPLSYDCNTTKTPTFSLMTSGSHF